MPVTGRSLEALRRGRSVCWPRHQADTRRGAQLSNCSSAPRAAPAPWPQERGRQHQQPQQRTAESCPRRREGHPPQKEREHTRLAPGRLGLPPYETPHWNQCLSQAEASRPPEEVGQSAGPDTKQTPVEAHNYPTVARSPHRAPAPEPHEEACSAPTAPPAHGGELLDLSIGRPECLPKPARLVLLASAASTASS